MELILTLVWLFCVGYIILLPHMPSNYGYWCELASASCRNTPKHSFRY